MTQGRAAVNAGGPTAHGHARPGSRLARSAALQAWVVIIVALASRLPQLGNAALLLDGDEATLGLMARHALVEHAWPVFFWGQDYGFSLVEVALGAAAFAVFGVKAWALKAAMLVLWTAGCVAFLFCLRALRPGPGHAAWLLAVLLVLSPAWALWAMKARGGYLTAFTCAQAACALLLHPAVRARATVQGLIGVLTTLVAAAQSLWLPLVGVLTVWAWACDRRPTHLLAWLGGAAATQSLFELARAATPAAVWAPPQIVLSTGVAGALSALPLRVFEGLTGAEALHRVLPAPPAAALFAVIAVVAIALAGGLTLARLRRMQGPGLGCALVVALLAAMLPPLVLAHDAPRYLLPLGGSAIMLVAHLTRAVQRTIVLRVALAGLLALGAAAQWQYRAFESQPGGRTALVALIATLDRLAIEAVYCLDPLLPWQLMFYSDERLAARFLFARDRHAPYIDRVRALEHQTPDAVALVLLYPHRGLLKTAAEGTRALDVGRTYTVVPQPGNALLDALGFKR